MDTAPQLGAFWGNDMAITFNPANMTTAEGKAREYNRLRRGGYTDAAIRQAAGAQTDSDWTALQNLAQKNTGIAFNPANMTTADGKAREYNRLRQDGFTDAEIRQAADNIGLPAGTQRSRSPHAETQAAIDAQGNNEWSYLRGLAQQQTMSPEQLASLQGLTPQQKAQAYLGGLAGGKTDAQLRMEASGLFGMQTDSDWNALKGIAQKLTPEQKAQVYNLGLSNGLTDAQLRTNVNQNVGQQTDADWQALTTLATNQRGNTAGGAAGGATGGAAAGGAAGGAAGAGGAAAGGAAADGNAANPYAPQALGNPFTYKPNPYLGEMAGAIRQQVTDNLQRNILPNIGSAAVAAGGYGGSRQGVVEANALKDANQGLSNSLANLYGQDYNSDMSRNLQKYQADQGYNLGVGNLGLGFQNSAQQYALGVGGLQNQRYGQDQNFALGVGNLGLGYQNSLQNFYTAQRGQDMQGMQLGANLFQQGNTGMQQQGQGLYNLGLTQQQAPWNVVGNYTNTVSPFTGFGNTSTSTPGNAGAGALGGAMVGAQLFNIFNKP